MQDTLLGRLHADAACSDCVLYIAHYAYAEGRGRPSMMMFYDYPCANCVRRCAHMRIKCAHVHLMLVMMFYDRP